MQGCRQTWEEGVSPPQLVGVVLVPLGQAERGHLGCIGKLQVGHMPVQQLPLQRILLACIPTHIYCTLQSYHCCNESQVSPETTVRTPLGMTRQQRFLSAPAAELDGSRE